MWGVGAGVAHECITCIMHRSHSGFSAIGEIVQASAMDFVEVKVHVRIHL